MKMIFVALLFCFLAAAECGVDNPISLTIKSIRCSFKLMLPCDRSDDYPYYYNLKQDECLRRPEESCLFGMEFLGRRGFKTLKECRNKCVDKKRNNGFGNRDTVEDADSEDDGRGGFNEGKSLTDDLSDLVTSSKFRLTTRVPVTTRKLTTTTPKPTTTMHDKSTDEEDLLVHLLRELIKERVKYLESESEN